MSRGLTAKVGRAKPIKEKYKKSLKNCQHNMRKKRSKLILISNKLSMMRRINLLNVRVHSRKN